MRKEPMISGSLARARGGKHENKATERAKMKYCAFTVPTFASVTGVSALKKPNGMGIAPRDGIIDSFGAGVSHCVT